MNCDSLLRLLDEIPLPLWTQEQQTSAHEHCRSCDNCRLLLRQQEELFLEFDEMILPEPSRTFELEIKSEPRRTVPSSGSLRRIFSSSEALFLCAGSVFQLFRESGFSLYWFADGSRLQSVITLLYSSPVLSVALTLVGLVYCLTRETNGRQEQG